MRVATFATNERMITAALNTQARMADLQLSQASGVKSTTYGGLGASARSVISLESNLKTSEAYEGAAKEADSRISVMHSTLSTITDLLTSFRGQLTSSMSTDRTDATDSALISAAQGYMTELASLLNTNYEGRYLFSGDAAQTVPVDLSSYAPSVDTASDSYYAGDQTVAAVKISNEQVVSYGVTADNAAFEEALRGLAAIGQAGTLDADLIQASYDLVLSALDKTIAVQSKLSIDAGTVERAQERQSAYQELLSSTISSLRDVDVTQVAVELASYETQLEASYSAISKIQSLSLQDYLR